MIRSRISEFGALYSISASSTSTTYRSSGLSVARRYSTSSSDPSTASTPGVPSSERSGERRGAISRTGVCWAISDRAIVMSVVDRPLRGGPATTRPGPSSATSRPCGDSSSPPAPAIAHSRDDGAKAARAALAEHVEQGLDQAAHVVLAEGGVVPLPPVEQQQHPGQSLLARGRRPLLGEPGEALGGEQLLAPRDLVAELAEQ